MSLSLKSIVAICFMLPMLATGCNKPQEKPEITKTEEPKEEKQKTPETKPPLTPKKQESTPAPTLKDPAPKSADADSDSKSQTEGQKGGGKSGSGSSGGGTNGGSGTPGGAPGSPGKTAPSGGRIPSLADSATPPRPTVGEALSKGEKELRAAKAALDKGDKTAAAKHAMLAWEATHDFGGNAECQAVNKQAEVLLEKFGAVPGSQDVDLSRVLIR